MSDTLQIIRNTPTPQLAARRKTPKRFQEPIAAKDDPLLSVIALSKIAAIARIHGRIIPTTDLADECDLKDAWLLVIDDLRALKTLLNRIDQPEGGQSQ